jgi:hypothetical protein
LVERMFILFTSNLMITEPFLVHPFEQPQRASQSLVPIVQYYCFLWYSNYSDRLTEGAIVWLGVCEVIED